MTLRRISAFLVLAIFLAAPAVAQVTEEDDLMIGAPVKPIAGATAPISAEKPAPDKQPALPGMPGAANPAPPAADAVMEDQGLTAPDPEISGQGAGEATAPVKDQPDVDAVYDAAFAKLTKAQQAELEVYDRKFTETLRPVVQVFRVGAGLEFCLAPPHLLTGQERKYIAAFKLYREQQDDAQEALWATHHDALQKIAYIEQPLLEAHYQSLAGAALQIAQQMVVDGGRNGAFDKTDCTVIQQILDSAIAKTAEKYRKAAELPKKPASKGTSKHPAR